MMQVGITGFHFAMVESLAPDMSVTDILFPAFEVHVTEFNYTKVESLAQDVSVTD